MMCIKKRCALRADLVHRTQGPSLFLSCICSSRNGRFTLERNSGPRTTAQGLSSCHCQRLLKIAMGLQSSTRAQSPRSHHAILSGLPVCNQRVCCRHSALGVHPARPDAVSNRGSLGRLSRLALLPVAIIPFIGVHRLLLVVRPWWIPAGHCTEA